MQILIFVVGRWFVFDALYDILSLWKRYKFMHSSIDFDFCSIQKDFIFFFDVLSDILSGYGTGINLCLHVILTNAKL